MPSFSSSSLEKLDTCDIDLQKLFNEVVKYFDCIILEGTRTTERQKWLFDTGKSKIDGVHSKSKHNYTPSKAVDVAPYFDTVPHIRWNDSKSFYFFAGKVIGISKVLFDDGIISHKIRWGGDWDSDGDLSDQSFNDLVHFELL